MHSLSFRGVLLYPHCRAFPTDRTVGFGLSYTELMALTDLIRKTTDDKRFVSKKAVDHKKVYCPTGAEVAQNNGERVQKI